MAQLMNGFTDKEIISGLIALLVASYAAFFGWVVASISPLDRKIDAVNVNLSSRIEALDTRLTGTIDALDAKLSTRLDALTIQVARLEGSMWGRTPPESPRKTEN
jgi:exosortase/archaeosortase